MTKKITIKKTYYASGHYESYTFQAIDSKGKKIFGASAQVSRSMSFGTNDWKPWKPSWGSCSYDTYIEMLPSFEAIKKAMALAKKLSTKN